MSNSTQFHNSDAFGSTFVDPQDPNYSVRFKTNRGRKNLNGLSVDNFVTEIIVSDLEPIEVGSLNANDTLAVRVRISGSELSHTRLKQIVGSISSQLPAWMDENVVLGFRPTTAPLNPDTTV